MKVLMVRMWMWMMMLELAVTLTVVSTGARYGLKVHVALRHALVRYVLEARAVVGDAVGAVDVSVQILARRLRIVSHHVGLPSFQLFVFGVESQIVMVI